jgi:hypothetical protein
MCACARANITTVVTSIAIAKGKGRTLTDEIIMLNDLDQTHDV